MSRVTNAVLWVRKYVERMPEEIKKYSWGGSYYVRPFKCKKCGAIYHDYHDMYQHLSGRHSMVLADAHWKALRGLRGSRAK